MLGEEGAGAGSLNISGTTSSSGSSSRSQFEQPYLQQAYLPPSPPKSRPPSPSRAMGTTLVQTQTQTQLHAASPVAAAPAPAATPTQHWNDLPAGFVQQAAAASTAIQRKNSQQSAQGNESQSASSATASKYPPAPIRSPLAGSFAQAAQVVGQNGGYHHHYDTAKDGPLSASLSNGYGRTASPLSSADPVAGSAFSSFYNRASDAVGLQTRRVSLPTYQGSSTATGSSGHARRKSIAQAVVPSISTLRFVTLCALWYTSSAVSNNTGKSILNSFRYPVTLTFIQFGFVAGWCVIFCVGRTKLAQWQQSNHHSQLTSSHSRSMSISQLYSSTWGIKRPTRKALEGTVVMSVFQVAGHIFSSMATARIPVSTVHTIKALSPLFTVASYAILFRVRYSWNTYTALLPLTIGVMLACSFDLRANAAGLVCALGSTVIFVSQNIFSKKLLPKDGGASEAHTGHGERKLDKLHLLLYSSGIAFLGMIPLWFYYDAYTVLFNATRTATLPTLFFYFTINGSVHFLQNLLAFSILSLTSPVTYSIASLIKRIAVICMAIVWFGQTVHGVQAVGISLTFLGLWMYNQAKGDVEKGENTRSKLERRGSFLLPTSKEDLSDSDSGLGSSTAGSKGRGWAVVR